MSDTTVTVGAVQLASGSDKALNLRTAIDLVHRAAGLGASYIQVPEYFNFLGPSRRMNSAAESVPGPSTDAMAEVARGLGVTVHLGSLLERSTIDGKSFNTSVVIGPTGQVVATYRKIHLFDVDVPGAIVHRESDVIEPGATLVVARVGEMSLGLSVCFDVRFPELYRALATSGAEVLAIPAAFNAQTGKAHWDVLVRARAIENHAFVVAAAQVGTTSEGIATFGHSMIVNPWGEVLAESSSGGTDILVAQLDLGDVRRRRQQIAVLDLRRPELYETPVQVVE